MDPLTGALLAAAVAWTSILAVIMAPGLQGRSPPPTHIRRLGAFTIALFAVQALGVPLPVWSPVAVFIGGLVVLVIIAPKGHAAAA